MKLQNKKAFGIWLPMSLISSKYWLLIAAAWYTINGVLHDIFVIRGHKGGYDRELLRLLMDGHILIFSGLLMGVAYAMANNNIAAWAATLGLLTAVSMLVYCCMIFPFLKSISTMAVSLMVLVVCIKLLFINSF